MAKIQLLIYSESTPAPGETAFGGKPVANVGAIPAWPQCKTCGGPMQYLLKVATDRGLNLVFMCQNDPGGCDEWDPDQGGNAVIRLVPGDLVEFDPPSNGETLRPVFHGCRVEMVKGEGYDDAREQWSGPSEESDRFVLGQLYGAPEWLQSDETPECNRCGKPMRHVAQLEQGPDYETEMNFGGGGCAYLFDCSCAGSAKFLWQC